MTDGELESLRERWAGERPLYVAFAQYAKRCLAYEAVRRGLICEVEARAKESKEFLKKALRKHYASPYDDIRDKAGARMIVRYVEDLPTVEEIVTSRFRVLKREDKMSVLQYNEFGYLGIHLEAEPLAEHLGTDGEHFRGRVCEIQLRTKAQDLWATISHLLTYKSLQETPPGIMRRIYRLAALIELFDDQVSSARGTIMLETGYQEAQLLDRLERYYYELTAKSFDRTLSIDVIKKLLGLFTNDEVAEFDRLMAAFVERNTAKLQGIYRAYRDDDRSETLLLFQPESLLIWERLEKDHFRLKEAWTKTFPLRLLEFLATAWGKAI
jgi:ppGpp synthetase/RelA/SpoT-type nucleotidyltranferase